MRQEMRSFMLEVSFFFGCESESRARCHSFSFSALEEASKTSLIGMNTSPIGSCAESVSASHTVSEIQPSMSSSAIENCSLNVGSRFWLIVFVCSSFHLESFFLSLIVHFSAPTRIVTYGSESPDKSIASRSRASRMEMWRFGFGEKRSSSVPSMYHDRTYAPLCFLPSQPASSKGILPLRNVASTALPHCCSGRSHVASDGLNIRIFTRLFPMQTHGTHRSPGMVARWRVSQSLCPLTKKLKVQSPFFVPISTTHPISSPAWRRRRPTPSWNRDFFSTLSFIGFRSDTSILSFPALMIEPGTANISSLPPATQTHQGGGSPISSFCHQPHKSWTGKKSSFEARVSSYPADATPMRQHTVEHSMSLYANRCRGVLIPESDFSARMKVPVAASHDLFLVDLTSRICPFLSMLLNSRSFPMRS
mmetsp:Transcript_20575/g.49837  ORF Transcript_20575/g.49837 Transcript_20575/m.49837 type:complete len:421 (+) Transcript_20575:1339-2601(+)